MDEELKKAIGHFLSWELNQPNVFCVEGAEIACELKGLGLKDDTIIECTAYLHEYVQAAVPSTAGEGTSRVIELLSYMFALNVFLGTLDMESEMLSQHCLRLIYERYRKLAEAKGLLDENGKLKEV